MVFTIQQHELAIGMHESLPPENPAPSPSSPHHSRLSEHRLSVPRIIRQPPWPSSLQMVTCVSHCSLKAVCGHLLLSHGCLSSQAPEGGRRGSCTAGSGSSWAERALWGQACSVCVCMCACLCFASGNGKTHKRKTDGPLSFSLAWKNERRRKSS